MPQIEKRMEASGITVESLRSKLIGQLQQIADIDVLKAIESVVEARQSEKDQWAIRKEDMHPELLAQLEKSMQQIDAGELVDNEDVVQEIDQWLNNLP